MSGKHSPGYWRKRYLQTREAKGITPRPEYDHLPRILQRGKELRELMLMSQGELFADDVSIARILADEAKTPSAPFALTQRRLKHDDLCSCGKPHNNNFPWTVRSDQGFGFNIYWFCSDFCKSKAVREHL